MLQAWRADRAPSAVLNPGNGSVPRMRTAASGHEPVSKAATPRTGCRTAPVTPAGRPANRTIPPRADRAHSGVCARYAVRGALDDLFQGISSIALTTNLGIASWGKVFNDDPMIAAAMLDRLLHRSVVLNIDGDSYRMRSHRARAEATRRAVAST